MSDETTNYETNNPEGASAGTTSGTAWTATGTAERVGFCQDCGTPLTHETARPVGAGVFCEPCLHARVATPVGAPPIEALSGTPHPVLAGLLGIIPGVGAMYNGQYAKGLAHLLIFAVLHSMSQVDHLGFFGLLAFIWWVYQIVDAYQTAKARLEGRPLPNPFGLNEVGERMGFGKNWGNATRTSGPAAPPYTAPPTSTSSQPYSSAYSTTTGPVSNGPDWVGYVPPTNFASAPPVPPASYAQTPYAQQPYTQTYSATTPGYTAPPMPVIPIVPPAKRFPVGAIWLIGLGVVFLLGEFMPDWGWSWHLSQNWLLALLFAGLSAWTLTRRLKSGMQSICGYRWPVILGVLALLFIFQGLDIASLGRTWPVLFIAFGVMLILERTSLGNTSYSYSSGYSSAYPADPYAPPTVADADSEEARPRAAWSAPAETHEGGTGSHGIVDDSTKGGL